MLFKRIVHIVQCVVNMDYLLFDNPSYKAVHFRLSSRRVVRFLIE